jgi:hypothetical protein
MQNQRLLPTSAMEDGRWTSSFTRLRAVQRFDEKTSESLDEINIVASMIFLELLDLLLTSTCLLTQLSVKLCFGGVGESRGV